MSRATISDDLRRLPEIVVREFSAAHDAIGDVFERGWKGQIVALDVIDSRTYLNAVEAGEAQVSGDVRTILIEAEAASGYADVQERGRRPNASGRGGYPGRYPAKRGVEVSDGDVQAELDKAGDRIR